jgi:MATE family multidrug resistance protein
MTADGVALGTLIAEVGAATLGFFLIRREMKRRHWRFDSNQIFDAAKFKRTISINGDIMVRTWCLVFAFWWHATQGAKAGNVIVSANAVLMHCFEVSAFLIDGFAYAAEALVGQAVGAGNRLRFRDAIVISTAWALVIGVALSTIIYAAGPLIIDMLAVNEDVRHTARIYLPWVALSSILGVICFQLDGIFTGATRTADMRNMMIISIVVYLVAWWFAARAWGNHGLWLALNIFFVIRAITLGVRLPALDRASFQPA